MDQNTPQPGAPQVMNPDDSYAAVFNGVYRPALFEKLAQDYNIRPASEAEATEMLTMAAQLRHAHDAQAEKQANAGGTLLSRAQSHLNDQLTELGYESQVNSNAQQTIKQAAAQAAQNPVLAHALLSMQSAAKAGEAA